MSVENIADDERRAVELDNRPAIVSSVLSLTAGLLAMLTSAPFSGIALFFGLTGLVFLGGGLFVVGSRQWVSLGVTSLFAGILVVGILGQATPLYLAISAVGLLVSWDLGQHAVTIGEQFGRDAPTQRGELVHAAGSGVVGVMAAGIAYGIYEFGTGDQPALVVLLLLIGVTALVWALRD